MSSISPYIQESLVIELEGTDKDQALRQIMDKIEAEHLLPDPQDFFQKILERESDSSTGIGLGIAIPHARVDALKSMVVAVGRSIKGIDFTTPDGTPVRLIFMIAVNNNQGEYLKIVARISWLVRNEEFRNRLFFSSSVNDLYLLLKEQG